ncbi:MAG: hypothetical protein IPK13_25750 [Deltaproteobacteria bacterium]|nr:hypothetical protein [Deltaproteobacteria bacterium]
MSSLVPVADHLFELVVSIDPTRSRWEDLSSKILAKRRALKAEIDEILERIPAETLTTSAKRALKTASLQLDDLASALSDDAEGSGQRRWRSIYGGLARAYEQLTGSLRRTPGYERYRFKTLRKRNFVRNLFHMTSGVVAALTYHFFLARAEALILIGVIAGCAALLEIWRRFDPRANDLLMRFPLFSHCARPHEFGRVNSSTYYVFGLLVATAAFPKFAVEVAALTLALADPVASNIGRRFGRHKLVLGKTLEGSLAFWGTGFLVAALYLGQLYPNIPTSHTLLLAAIAGLAGALTELVSTKLDDNLTIPVTVGAAVASTSLILA